MAPKTERVSRFAIANGTAGTTVQSALTESDRAGSVAPSNSTEKSSDVVNPRHRKLKKLLEQIHLLEEKQARGETLNEDQLGKVSKKAATETEIHAILAGASPAEKVLSLEEEVEAALAIPKEIQDHAVCLDKESEKRFRGVMRSLRDFQKLQAASSLDKLQQKKLEKLREEAPLNLSQFRSLLDALTELRSSGHHDLEQIIRDRQNAAEQAAKQKDEELTQAQHEKEVHMLARREEDEVGGDPARPATTAVVARRLVHNHLQVKMSAEFRAEERSFWKNATADAVATCPRAIGVDVGGVLTQFLNDNVSDTEWHKQKESEVTGAMRVLKLLVRKFGHANVHIVSKCSGIMREQTYEWLTETMNITRTVGIPKENIHFCPKRSGPEGKGAWANWLKLSHFIDDRHDCLWSVYFDEKNSQEDIRRHNGKLYYFQQSGAPAQVCSHFRSGSCKWGDQCKYSHGDQVSACYPHWPKDTPKPDCVVAVDDWDHVERLLDDM